MNIVITVVTAFILCVVLSFVSMLLTTFFGQDIFNGQMFVLTVVLTTAVLHYVGCINVKKT